MEQDTHIVKSYDEEMKEINNSILDIGSLVENQLKEALDALKNQDTELADKVIQADNLIDEKFRELDQKLVLILGKRQPMATDLRTIFSAIKMNKDLERLGEIDDEYLGILRQLLTYMMEDPKRISACTNLLYMVKDLERAGDYVQNIAEDIYYAVSGEPLYNDGPDREWEAIKPLKKKK